MDKYLYEIPPNLLNKEMLMVTRISKTANGIGYGQKNKFSGVKMGKEIR